MKILEFLTTKFGSWVKVFAAIMCTLIAAEGNAFLTWDKVMLNKIIIGAATALGPMLLNSINPKYALYGNRETKENVVVDKKSGEEVAP